MKISFTNNHYTPDDTHRYEIEVENEQEWRDIFEKYSDLQLKLSKKYNEARAKHYSKLERP